MKPIQLICQNCKMQYKTIKEFKAHVRSYEHKQEVAKMFGTALHKGPVYFPGFAFPDYLKDSNKTHPLIGFDLVTMFITPERFGDFYLCHVCEERLSNKDVVFHLCSFDHYFAYLAYTNPELLRFAWLDESHSYLKSSATKEYTTNGPGNLRVFELSKRMLASCKNMLYHQVMLTSSSNNLTERFQTGIPQRKTIQEYITDPARINPLLGMNLVLEYSCPTNEGYCAYLCVLCRKRLSANQIISHCISFDHIYWYLKAAHPGTLHSPKDKYSHYYSFHKEVLNVAKQAQTLCPPKEIQSISLDLEGYKVVNSSSYASALEKLQKIRRDRNESELSVNITAGERIMLAPEKRESSVRTTTRDISAQQPEKKREIAPITKPNANPPCRILCVECDKSVNSLKEYKKHIKEMQHRQRLIELFGPGQYSDVLSDFKLYADMRKRGPLSPPLIGLPLLTVFVQRHTMAVNTAFYLCHACEIYVHGSSTSLHFASEQHCLNVLLYSKPDLVFLKSSNWSQIALEEQSKENHEPVLKVCELPRKRFKELRTLVYDKFIERIETNFTALRECFQAEKRVTLQSYSKCSERKSPLLGLQFMVKFTTTQPYNKCGFLCLLCEKRLPERQTIDHVLSFAHIYTYLDLVHPGSLCKEDSGLVSLISDLAHQAEKITSHTTLREVDVSFEMFNNIERNSFTYVVNVLQEVFKEKGLGELKPSIVPGERLVSSFKMNNENTSTTCEKQKHSPTDSEMQNVDGTCIVTMQNSEEQIESEYHDLVHAEDENLLETTSITSPHIQTNEKILETSQSNVNSSEPQSPSLHKEQPESLKLDQKTLNQEGLPDHHSTGNAETVKLPQSQDSNVPQQQSTELAQKPPIKMEAPQKPAQSPDFLSLTVHQTHLSTCSELRRFLETPNREPVIGLKTVIECSTVGQQPFYMCITCVERCEESLIVEHILSHQHRLQFLTSIEVCGIEPGKKVTLKWLKAQADMIEKKQGCGEAKTLNLDAEDYHEIFTAPIETALENLRLAILKLASEIGTQNTDAESDMGHEYKTSTITRETEENEEAHVKIPEPDLEPETSLKNSTDPVQSSPYLWSFLISPTRTEPVIGLSMVTEYRSSSGLNSFLCSCCKMILNTNCYVDHLISSDHRFNYIKSVDPEFVVHCQDEHKNSELQKKAQILQDSEGWGCLKVVEKENKQPQKTQPLLSDAETKPKIQNQEPTQASSDTDAESQNLKSNESKSTTRQNKTKINNAVTEPQDYNRHEPKQQVKKKINKQRVAIGLNFVTCVTHNKKKLFFCELCSVRGHLDHMSSESHRKAYVEYKYGYTVRGTNMEKKLYKIALGLAKVEKSTGVGMKKLTVTAKVFAALRAAPLSEALNHLKLLQTKPEEALKTTLLPALGIITEHGSAVTTSCLQHDYSSFYACSQSVFREENKHLHDTTVSKIYCLPKLPTVMGQSNASIFLNVKGLSTTEPIIGLSNIVECRGILHPTFFLCLSCAEKVSKEKFCDHMTSERHQFLSIKTQYPVEFQQWQGQMNHQITTRYFAEKLALTERGLDAKVIKLNQSQYELLSSAEFHDAIEILQRLFGPCVDDSTQLLHPAGQNQKRNVQGNVPNVTPTLEAKKSEEHAGNSHTQTDLKSISKHRTEADALVGLSAVIECRVKGQALLYLCMSCSSKLDPHLINYHLVKPGHRYSYLKRRYPDMFENWSESDSRPDKSMTLMQFSQQVEMNNEDEPGQPQVITLKHDDLKEIKAMPYNKAIIHLQKIRKEQNLRSFKTCISPKIRKRLIKQERMETITTQCSQEQLVLHGSRRASKRRAVDQDLPLLSVRAKKQCSSSDFEQSPQIIVNNLDSVAQFQQESSYCTPATNVLDPVSQSYKSATSLHTTVLKNSLEQESSVTEPQQKDISSNTSTISALSNTSTISALSSETGQEIARLTEKRPLLKNSLSENAWHYEIREFSPETPSMTNANPVAEDSTESLALKHQSTAYSYNEPFSYNSLVSSFGKETSVTSQVTPEYALAYQYPMYKHPDYPSVIADSNSVASDYLVPIETAINYESAAAGISTNDADLMAANSAHTLPTVYVGVPVYPQVYQPIQSPQNQETFQPYYACGSYQQTPLTSTTAEENVISTPALEHGVYPLASWPQMKK